MDYQLLFFCIVVVAMIVCAFLFPLKCPDCRTKLKFEIMTDTFGLNITKRLILTPRMGGPGDRYYSCPKCRKYFKERKNKLEEVKRIPPRMVMFE